LTNWLLYIYCFSLPYQAITIGGIAIVKITGLLLSGWLAVELGFRKFNKSDLTAVLIVSMAPLYLFIGELIRTSAADAINFYMPFISNVLLFILMILSSHALNFRRALTVLVASSFIVPAVMISPFADIGEDGRVSALGLNANFSALLLSLSFIYLSIFARRQRTDLSSLTMYLLAVIPFLGVISTGTRFGLIVCAFFVFFVLYRAAASRFGSLLAILSTGLVMLIGVYIAMSSNLVVVTRFMELSETITTQGRIVLWGLALDAVDSNYTFGVGPNAFNSYIVPNYGIFHESA
jgi:O-antigen ligase